MATGDGRPRSGRRRTRKRCSGRSRRRNAPRGPGSSRSSSATLRASASRSGCFDEGRRRHERGEDVVVAAMQPDVPPDAAQVIRDLERHPAARDCRRAGPRRAGVLARQPRVCLVDGLAYDNPPGSRHAKRYQDVEDLLEAGISVLTSINLEYIAEQQDVRARGRRPRAGRDRAAGVHRPGRRSGRRRRPAGGRRRRDGGDELSALRQRALLLTAEVVDRQLEDVPAPARHPVVVGHAGTDPRLHDAAGQRRQDAGQRPHGTPTASTASCSPSTSPRRT